MATLTIDGRVVQAPDGAPVLEAVRQAGAHLPTLCYWEGLPPYGACRLCLVEVQAPQRPPQRQVVAACSYPVSDGLEIETQGKAAVSARRMMIELLLARCPGSPYLQQLAAEAGVTPGRLEPVPGPSDGNDLCILCGLCVRVCRDLVGAAAIGFTARGRGRGVAAPFRVQSDACIGCGACAAVCPTGAVQIEDVDGVRRLRTWNTEVELRPCPRCGQPFAPEPMAFLQGLADVSADPWGLCPACRRKGAARVISQAGTSRIEA